MPIATSPAYSAAEQATWQYGHATYHTSLDGNALGSGVGGMAAWTYPLNLQPGIYDFTEILLRVASCGDVLCDAIYFAIYERDGTTFTAVTLSNGLKYVDITANKPAADANCYVTADLTGVSVTLESGKTYHMAWLAHKLPAASANTPVIVKNAAAVGPQGGWYEWALADTTIADAATFTGTENAGSLPFFRLTFKTSVRKLLVSSYAAASKLIIPRCTDKDWCIKFTNSLVEDGQAFTCVLETVGTAEKGLTTLIQDLGATDQMTFGGANVALNAGTSEGGDNFDLLIQVRPVTGKMDLFYQNMEHPQGPNAGVNLFDFATFSHAVRATTTRGADYTIASPHQLDMSGTATVEAIEVGWEPVVSLGDSQIYGQGIPAALGAAIPGAFTYPRIGWTAGAPGGRIAASVGGVHTAAYLRYKNGTAGNGDICEMTSIVLCIMCGVNDLLDYSEGEEPTCIRAVANYLATIMAANAEAGNACILMALPPKSSVGYAEWRAAAIRDRINPLYEGLAIAYKASFLNPYYYCLSGSDAIPLPKFNATYSYDGSHFNAAGAAYIVQFLAREYEKGTVGARMRRTRTPGLLIPI